MQRLQIVIDTNGHLIVEKPLEDSRVSRVGYYRDKDLGQVIGLYREQGYRHVREDDTDWLVREDGWEAINEVIEGDDQLDNVAYQKGQDGE